VVEQVPLARDTYRLRLLAPEIARQAVPGQFFMIRSPGTDNPLLGRPFALYDTWLDAAGLPAGIDVVYLVVGKMTRLMSTWTAGDSVELWGPLGNGFPVIDCARLLIVAGGIGNTPFLAVTREIRGLRQYGEGRQAVLQTPRQVTYCYGARSREYLAGIQDMQTVGAEVRLSTDDGSAGHRGFVTDLARQALSESQPPQAIFCCGPEPLMRGVAALSKEFEVPCWLSLETPMACGFGACFSCVTKVHEPDGTWDYRRVCVEGPIFPAERLAL
jgi:dihydroorotate dehydrogenase electron transfer subunit